MMHVIDVAGGEDELNCMRHVIDVAFLLREAAHLYTCFCGVAAVMWIRLATCLLHMRDKDL
jgi:hypothetical protein